MDTLTLFSWGYWGWGTSTPQLLQAVEAAEAARGFRPPVFVDIRFSRSVRAPGFRDGTFEKLVGQSRYFWMKSLGNSAIRTGGLTIADPAAAEELLDVAVQSGRDKRRVLFFCACEFPRLGNTFHCHREEVASLVLKEAHQQAPTVAIMEWPGDKPITADLAVKPATLQAVRRGRKTVPLGEELEPRFAGLPWGSIVTLRAGGDSLAVISGPAKFKGEWVLPVLGCGDPTDEPSALKEEAQQVRGWYGFESRKS